MNMVLRDCKSPWITALPALIIGPVTYLFVVSVLILRQRRMRQVMQ